MEQLPGAARQPRIGTLRKLWSLIPRAQRRQAPLLLLLLFIGTSLEVVGIGLLVPLVNLLTNENASPDNSILSPVFNLFGATTQLQMSTVGFISIGVVVLVKNVYLVCTTYFQNSQVSKIQTSVDTRMFKRYLQVGYVFHLRSNSSTLSRNLITEVDQITTQVLTPMFAVVVEGAAVLGIMALLVYVEPVASLTLVVFFAICGITYTKAVSPLLSRIGGQRAVLRGEAFKIIAETLGGIKQIKVLGHENFFQTRFSANSKNLVRLSARTETVQRIPVYLVELWGVLGLLVVVFTMLLQGKSTVAIVSSLGLFVGASFRFVPALNRIVIASQALKLTKPAIDVVYKEVSQNIEVQTAKRRISFTSELKFDKISFSYDSESAHVLDNVSLTLAAGESLGIVGPSGAGKTTLVDLLLGLLAPASGQVVVDGQAIDLTKSSWQSEVGYVPQEIFLIDDTIRNNIAFGIAAHEISEAKIEKSIATAQLTDFVNGLPDGLDTVTGERGVRLSGGQRQRIGIARALYHEPSLLVLDEATSALDLETESEFIETLETIHQRITMIIVSHRMSTLKYCDRIVRLEGGALTEVR
jgi:ABC-type multidrug transport system fused ATPase/permease subunit